MNIRALILLSLFLAGCSTVSVEDHFAKVDELRARTPYRTHIGLSRSMDTVLPSGSFQTIQRLSYDSVRPGMIVVFWPYGWNWPVAHFVGHPIGSDSWSTYPMGGIGDDTNRWILTRENYIGVIY